MRLSFHPELSGDVKVLLKPYHLFATSLKKSPAYATTHGSPHPYDTHVPLLVYGPGVRPGVRDERVTPLSVAAILCRALGVEPPEGAEGTVPDGLFR